MAPYSLKHSKEALAFWTLFKAMKPEIKQEVRDIINNEAIEDELPTEALTSISANAFKEVWDSPENDSWDEFIKQRLHV